ncbi:Acyl-CoA N-acyltransferase [Cordyceps fumosorosea ARSEF 2679]|uniref:Acyl-CoA N-acyltransferase n=1 Tax=Cordyceps fumosorosea (strain ARSEF 2679) TaxID=1081104 RepID=A0A168EBS5_CORFA|nr:Acyl-CoA N-acyltransferase [Cordyceps fumosorosea ARSEF 2679]OAA73621.1 Acyl-CoA N-acyltransferase [Cordyceps fumosorosea ARSEF 2679]
MPPLGIRIARLQPEDIPFAARLAGQAFASDRQTQMKALGEEEPFDMEKYTLESMPAHLTSRTCHVIKAVDEATGEIMGVCNWGIKGFVPERLPLFEERVAEAAAAEAKPKAEPKKEEEDEEEEKKEDKQEETDPIKRLVALTDADMQAWMAEVMPPGTRCLFIIGLTVAPAHQGRGVGGALLRWGTRVCDEAGVFAWVHASDPSWGAYRKAGFEVVRSLDLDLDAYAPCPPPASEREGARWGHYVFRYMKYLPRPKEEGKE